MTHFNTPEHSAPEYVPNVGKHLFKARTPSTDNVEQEKRRPSISYWQDAWIRFRQNRIALACAGYVVLLISAAIIIPPFLNYTAAEQEIWNKDTPPNLGHLALVMDDGVSMHPVSDEPEEPLTGEEATADDGSNPSAATPANDGMDAGTANEAAGTNSFQDEWGDGSGSTTNDAAEALPTEPPTAPADLRLSGEATTLGVRLEWSAIPGVDGYRIYRSINEDGQGGIPIGDVDSQHTGYFDDVALKPETYFYSVRAYNTMGEGADSIILKVAPKLALPLADALRFDPDAKVGSTVLTSPHYLGTDYLGRDLMARLLVGARYSLGIGLLAPLIYIFIGIIYGSISGYFGKWIDDLMMRVADIVLTIPDLLVVILIQVVLGKGVVPIIIALCVTSWARSARQIRGQVLQIREMEFVHAAEVLGTSTRKIITRHLLPNVMGTVLVLFTLSVPSAIFTEAFLSFIGLGIEPPTPSWGTIVREGAKVFLTYPHSLLIPASLICMTMLAFNLLGDGLRDALDPKLRGAK